MKCYLWKSNKHTCEKKQVSSKHEDVQMPDLPFGRHGLVTYADFESIVQDTGHHKISGFGAITITNMHTVFDVKKLNYLNNQHLISAFIDYLCKIANDYANEGEESHICTICEQEILPNSDVIVGKNYINGRAGSNHVECWEHPKNTMYVFFHNFRGYDSHFLIKEIVATCEVLGLIATSMEKFNLISIKSKTNDALSITFKDTFNFFSCSLAKCVSMVENWVYTPEDIRKEKGIFPYDWFNDFSKLEAEALPPRPWYNKLTNTIVDPTPAYEAWEKRNFKYFWQYHDFYMMTDVYQLADVFEEFRRTCVDEFDIDPVHFQGAPSLTWYLGVAQNPEMFKIIKDKDVYMDIQNNIRGGISQAMTKYCNVENKPDESMFFLDVNSLYSKCMTYKMPGKYLGKITSLPDNWQEQWNPDTNKTAFICCDLVYPPHLHDRDWAYPLAPHKYNDRLCTTFKNRENYIVHAELLSFYLERGLVLEKVHYCYLFEQDYTLRDYVQANIEKRRHTRSEVMKTLYKLLNNSLYGKTCENVNKYRKFAVVKDESLTVDIMDPDTYFNRELANCTNIIACGENFLVEKELNEVRLNKPIQIGFAILEFAKREIYKFLAMIADHFGDEVIPLYTDTDSLLFWCHFPSPWKRFYDSPLLPYLDFEKAPAEWNVKTNDTDKQSGLWSPEAGGKEIVEYCGLRAKCYCYRFRDNEVVIKNKGVPKAAMIGDDDETPREKINMNHYREALFNSQNYQVVQYAIRSFKHEVITRQQYKLGLTSLDFKRAVTTNKAITLPFGYQGQTFAEIVADADDTSNLDT
uniref:DNA-directed DNA polymerase n=1 Tax=Passer montanus parvoviridae sp. TaxID=2794522 RepID=A0A8A4XC85_9VIRU|nr:MAG: structural protein [Passer montanus parvoviridae sp.]